MTGTMKTARRRLAFLTGFWNLFLLKTENGSKTWRNLLSGLSSHSSEKHSEKKGNCWTVLKTRIYLKLLLKMKRMQRNRIWNEYKNTRRAKNISILRLMEVIRWHLPSRAKSHDPANPQDVDPPRLVGWRSSKSQAKLHKSPISPGYRLRVFVWIVRAKVNDLWKESGDGETSLRIW